MRNNDLFVTLRGSQEIRITTDGSKNILNGISDWVYEEEILADGKSAWLSPSGYNVAFIKYDDSLVEEYKIQYYAKFGKESYPREVAIKYPKPGTPNPIVNLFISVIHPESFYVESIQIKFEQSILDDDRVFTQITWTSDSDVIVRVMNRVQDVQRIFIVSKANNWVPTMVRDESTPDGAWHNRRQPLYLLQGTETPHYVEAMENDEGFVHLAYFSDISNAIPTVWLTIGSWEIDEILGFDLIGRKIYFSSTEVDSTQRQIYR